MTGIGACGAARRMGAVLLSMSFALGGFLAFRSTPTHASALKAMWGPSIHNGVSVFPTFKDLGVNIYEDDLHWDLIARRRPRNPRQPNDPAYVWPAEVSSAV